ncbi:MAG: hypothetical protein ACREMP_05180 [Candidatus Tyrphobacter sp.]
MVRGNLIAIVAALAATALYASAAEPPHYTFSPKPPGKIVQSLLFYPAGEGMQSQWRAVSSRVYLGGSAYQWHLSIYAIDFDAATYRLKYQSPRDGGPLSRVTRVGGGPWLPLETLDLVGVAELEHPGVQNLVVQTHEASADCGGASVIVYAYDWVHRRIRSVATVTNGCALRASIVHGARGYEIVLAGPYYAPNAPLCCPTRVRARAILRYSGSRWIEIPALFTLQAH